MKRTGFDSPKIGRLAMLLGERIYAARGIVESLWHFAAKHALAGDVGKWSDGEIAAFIGWEGDPKELVKAMIDARLLDEIEGARLFVHDWDEHCEDSVHVALARKVLFFANGTMPRLTRLAKNERSEIEEAYKVAAKARKHTKAHKSTQGTHLGASESTLPCLSLSHSQAMSSHASVTSAAEAAAPTRSKSIAAGDVTFPEGMDSPSNRAALDQWLAHKRSKRESYKDADQVRILLEGFVRKHGSNASKIFGEAVLHSIGQNYSGLFASKDNHKPAAVIGAGQKYDPTKGERSWRD